jgi:hypothetical protein
VGFTSIVYLHQQASFTINNLSPITHVFSEYNGILIHNNDPVESVIDGGNSPVGHFILSEIFMFELAFRVIQMLCRQHGYVLLVDLKLQV